MLNIKPKPKGSNQGKKNNPRKKRSILKFFLMGFGTIADFVLALGIWIYVSLFSESDAMEMSVYHPFRSAIAKEKYLKHYDMKTKNWPVASDSRMVETSFGKSFVRIMDQLMHLRCVLVNNALY
jgi:hypothetical protein